MSYSSERYEEEQERSENSQDSQESGLRREGNACSRITRSKINIPVL